MMGRRQVEQGALFYEFSLDTHVPADHLLRGIDRFVDLSGLRAQGLQPGRTRRGALAHSVRIVQPVVLRASRSRCACAASFSA